MWKLSAQTQQWLGVGVDLVVCELSRIHPNAPRASIAFTVPTWIQQSLTLSEPLDALLSGRRMKSVRHDLNRAEKAGFSWYFSTSQEDFDYFHSVAVLESQRNGAVSQNVGLAQNVIPVTEAVPWPN